MTSPMTWSSASTNKRRFAPCRCCRLAAFGGGCAHPPPPAPPLIRGAVNLDALVRRHPGWSGVSQYDAALRRLQKAARSLPPEGRPDQKMAILPALSVETMASGAAPAADAAQIGRRLDAVQQSLLDGVQARREAARRDELRQQQDVWRREARTRFVLHAPTVGVGSDLELQILQANVATLTRTIANWKQSLAALAGAERTANQSRGGTSPIECPAGRAGEAAGAAQARRTPSGSRFERPRGLCPGAGGCAGSQTSDG